jgi:prepilin-type N-terminal cleavage/methylation domain-containing protein
MVNNRLNINLSDKVFAVRQKDQKQTGFSLVEVLMALAILTMIAVTVLGISSVSSVWVIQAGQRTQATDYASSIIETVRENASELKVLNLENDMTWEVSDHDLTDQRFVFQIDPECLSLSIPAPENLQAFLAISLHDASAYYETNMDLVFEDNLFDVNVTVTNVSNGSILAEMTTVIQVRAGI